MTYNTFVFVSPSVVHTMTFEFTKFCARNTRRTKQPTQDKTNTRFSVNGTVIHTHESELSGEPTRRLCKFLPRPAPHIAIEYGGREGKAPPFIDLCIIYECSASSFISFTGFRTHWAAGWMTKWVNFNVSFDKAVAQKIDTAWIIFSAHFSRFSMFLTLRYTCLLFTSQ